MFLDFFSQNKRVRPEQDAPRYTPLIDDAEARCRVFQFSENMGGNDNGCSVIPIHRCDQIADVRDALRVQTVDWLI